MRSAIVRNDRVLAAAGGLLLVLLLLCAPARAATDIYPPGSGTFSDGPQGWQATEAICDVVLCSASAGYDDTFGDPAGSLAADSNISVGLLSLFGSDFRFVSPRFEVDRGQAGTLHLDRAFDPGELLSLAPESTYAMALLDRDDGDKVVGELTGSLSGEQGFSGENAAVSVSPGHEYALAIEVNTTSTVLGAGILGGVVRTSLDSARLLVQSSGSGGNGNGSGDNGGNGSDDSGEGANGADGNGADARDRQLSNRALAYLVRRFGLPRRAVLRAPGRYAVTRVRCPARARHACVFAVRGMAGGRRAATAPRRVRVGRGSSRQVGLLVRPRFRARLRRGNSILVRMAARSGSAHTVVLKRLRLIKRR